MRLNLLASTAAAAIIASGGMWAQAQTPGGKQDEKAPMHEQKGENHNRAHDEKPRADKSRGALQAQDGQQKRNAHNPMSAKKGDTSKTADQAPSKQPRPAVENQKSKSVSNERDGRNAASEVNKGKEQPNSTNASTENKDQNSAAGDGKTRPRAAEQKTGDQKAAQSKQTKSSNQPNTSAADSPGGTAKNQPAQNQNAAQRNMPSSNQKNDSTDQKSTSTSNTEPSNTASTKLSEGDRSKVFSTLKSDRRTSNQRIDIEVNVGTRLPPRVHPRPLPRTVVEVLPQYRGYEFVMVRDEIAIVRPGTREVVDVIHEPGSSSSFAARSAGGSRATIHLTDQQRTKLRTEARRFTSSQVSSSGSQCLSLQPVPASLANENPDLKQYQMLAIGEDIVLVDRNSKKVVDVIQ